MPQPNTNVAQLVSMAVHPRSAQRSLVKVESGINGLLPTSWASPIYSVSLLTKLHCALGGNGILRPTAVSLVPRSHLPNAKLNENNEEIRNNRSGA